MAENLPEDRTEDKPAKQPYGPGVLMILGLFMVVIAAWCAYDLATQEAWQKEGRTGAIAFNWAGLVIFSVAAVYTFVLAAKRSRGEAEAGGSALPPPPGAPDDEGDGALPPDADAPDAPDASGDADGP